MKPLKDGTTVQLVPFLNCLDIHHPDETWTSLLSYHTKERLPNELALPTGQY
jgi:hypothetical protein